MTATGLACPVRYHDMILLLRRSLRDRDTLFSKDAHSRTLSRRETTLVDDLPGTAHPRMFAHLPLRITQTRLGAMLKGAVTHRAPPFFGLCYVPIHRQPRLFLFFVGTYGSWKETDNSSKPDPTSVPTQGRRWSRAPMIISEKFSGMAK